MSTLPRALIEVSYAEYAREYLRSLPPEHFMEATTQSRQREITLESFALIRRALPRFHYFNELLVQYPRPGQRKPGQVVPDNMVVVHDGTITAEGSYDVPLQPAAPFWVLEYVSKNSRRKDYDHNFDLYEKELKVPYFLLFYPETQDLTLYRYSGDRYQSVPPDEHGRHALPELELQVGLLDGWVRYWFRGELLPLPAELQNELDEARKLLLEQRRRADEQSRRADEQQKRADDLRTRYEEEQRARQALEEEIARLRAQRGGPPG